MRRVAKALKITTLVFAIFGIGLLSLKAAITFRTDWVVAEIAVPPMAHPAAETTFLATDHSAYEIVLEYESVIPRAELRRLLRSAGNSSAADIRWTVTDENRPVAAGGSDIPVYHSSGGKTLAGRLKRWLFSLPYHRDRASFIQVIGRLPVETGKTYKVVLENYFLDPALTPTSPRLAVRPDRDIWFRHDQQTRWIAQLGLTFVAVSVILAGIAFIMLLIGRALGSAGSGTTQPSPQDGF